MHCVLLTGGSQQLSKTPENRGRNKRICVFPLTRFITSNKMNLSLQYQKKKKLKEQISETLTGKNKEKSRRPQLQLIPKRKTEC